MAKIPTAGTKPEPAKHSNIYTVTDPEGKVWILRPIPKHMFLFAGQLPTAMTEKAIKALNNGDEESFSEEVQSSMTQKQIFDSAIFARDAVTFACVKPRITMSPESADDISPFNISEEVFLFLTKTVMNPKGGQAQVASNFRGEQ